MPVNKMFFFAALGFLCVQRLAELLIARANEKWLRQRDAREFGEAHYRWIVLLHIGFIASLIVEGWWRGPKLIAGWPIVLAMLGSLQILRYWCIFSLGRFWNTKIFVIPGEEKIRTGPYRWLRHPNYLVVVLEILFWPLLFSCWITLLWAGAANALALSIRIRQENAALAHLA
jgi:methyltransferase